MGLKKSKLKYSVNVNNDQNVTSFEGLSNELIYEIFDLLSDDDINRSFTQLNKRLQRLVQDYQYSHNPDVYPADHPCRYLRSKGIMCIRAKYQVALVDFTHISSIQFLRLSNIKSQTCLDILEKIPAEQLESIYVGALSDRGEYYNERDPVDQLQEKILQLAQFKLRKCTFRMKFMASFDRIPEQLPRLEYLRIDGCQDVSVVHQLVNRMPRLKKCQVSIMDTIPNSQIRQVSPIKQPHSHLTHLSIHALDLRSPKDLETLFDKYGSNLQVLIIRLKPIVGSTTLFNPNDIAFANRHEWTQNIIPLYLPRLREFHLNQSVTPNIYASPQHIVKPSPYETEILHSALSTKSYHVFIAEQLASIWLNSP